MSDKQIHKARLADIDVKEISHVDRAANKRKWLFRKRDTSEDNEGGENLELLKAFKKDPQAIEALEGIEANLVKFDQALAKRLEDPKLTAEEKTLLLAKKGEYEDLKAELEDGFEQLFLDKKYEADSDEESADEEEADEEEDEEVPPVKAKKKGKKVAKSDDEAEDEDDSEDEESEEETEAELEKKDDEGDKDEDDEKKDDESKSDDDIDDEDKPILEQIQKELEKGEQLRKEVRELTAPKNA